MKTSIAALIVAAGLALAPRLARADWTQYCYNNPYDQSHQCFCYHHPEQDGCGSWNWQDAPPDYNGGGNWGNWHGGPPDWNQNHPPDWNHGQNNQPPHNNPGPSPNHGGNHGPHQRIEKPS